MGRDCYKIPARLVDSYGASMLDLLLCRIDADRSVRLREWIFGDLSAGGWCRCGEIELCNANVCCRTQTKCRRCQLPYSWGFPLLAYMSQASTSLYCTYTTSIPHRVTLGKPSCSTIPTTTIQTIPQQQGKDNRTERDNLSLPLILQCQNKHNQYQHPEASTSHDNLINTCHTPATPNSLTHYTLVLLWSNPINYCCVALQCYKTHSLHSSTSHHISAHASGMLPVAPKCRLLGSASLCARADIGDRGIGDTDSLPISRLSVSLSYRGSYLRYSTYAN